MTQSYHRGRDLSAGLFILYAVNKECEESEEEEEYAETDLKGNVYLLSRGVLVSRA